MYKIDKSKNLCLMKYWVLEIRQNYCVSEKTAEIKIIAVELRAIAFSYAS